MEDDGRLALRVSARLPIDEIAVADLEQAMVEGLDLWVHVGHRHTLVTSSAMSVWAILAAAGSGERLGLDRPKAFASLNDRPLVAEPLERLDGSDWIEGIVIAAPPEWEEPCILVAEEVAAGKVAKTVTGGASRSESVRAALAEVPDEATVVLVHDAARPVVPEEVIERLVTALADGWDAAVPVAPDRRHRQTRRRRDRHGDARARGPRHRPDPASLRRPSPSRRA